MSRKYNKLKFLRIALVGDSAPVSELEFGPGLTVISGISNTGKSMSQKMVDFTLGGANPTNGVEEAIGYSSLRMEVLINGPDAGKYVIDRNFNSGSSYVSRIDNKSEDAPQKEIDIMDLLNLKGVVLKKSAKEHCSASLRHLSHATVISQTRVSSEYSPFYPLGQFTSNTTDWSAWVYFFSGLEYSSCDKFEELNKKVEINKNEQKGIIAALPTINALLLQKAGKSGSDTVKEGELKKEIEELSVKIAVSSNMSDELTGKLSISLKRASSYRIKYESVLREIADLTRQKKRLGALKKHHAENIKRLTAMSQAIDAARLCGGVMDCGDKTDATICPLCGGKKSTDNTSRSGSIVSVDIDELAKKYTQEVCRIEIIGNGLDETILDLNSHLDRLSQLATDIRSKLDPVDALVEQFKLSLRAAKVDMPSSLSRYRILSECCALIEQVDRFNKRIRLLKEDVKYLKPQIAEEKLKLPDGDKVVMDTFMLHIIPIMKELLLEWGIDVKKITVKDDSGKTLVIDGKDYKNNGAGYRGVIFSSMLVAICEYCTKMDLPHPGFVFLDTPVNAYRGKDDDLVGANKTLAEKFYRSLDRRCNDIGYQIITVEKIDPPTDLSAAAKKIRFYGATASEGQRVGLFPKSSNLTP